MNNGNNSLPHEEFEQKTNEFQAYLHDIDKEYSDYFQSDAIEVDSIEYCFATVNGATLKPTQQDLRQDISEKVIQKHKEIWGEHHFLQNPWKE